MANKYEYSFDTDSLTAEYPCDIIILDDYVRYGGKGNAAAKSKTI